MYQKEAPGWNRLPGNSILDSEIPVLPFGQFSRHTADMVGPVKGRGFGFFRLHGNASSEEEEKSRAGWLTTVDQPDIRGLVTDMT
jgi:hypothetical protein